jgi:large subunit ribosomal protein L9
MKVIFLEQVLHVAKKGEIKEVSSWYASNFLLPKKLAKPYTDTLAESIEQAEQKKEAARRILLWSKQELVDALSGEVFPFELTGSGSKVYGSIVPRDVAEYVAKKYKIPVTKKHIDFGGVHSALKTLWKHDIYVDFGGNYAAKAVVEIKLK